MRIKNGVEREGHSSKLFFLITLVLLVLFAGSVRVQLHPRVFLQLGLHRGKREDLGLHPPAVRARVAREVYEHELLLSLRLLERGSETRVPGEFPAGGPASCQWQPSGSAWGQECVQFTQGGAQQPCKQIEADGEKGQRGHQAHHAYSFERRVVGKLEFPQQVDGRQDSGGDPDC